MIQLTRLNRIPMVLNSDLIEHIEITPDTVITLTTGQKIVVLSRRVTWWNASWRFDGRFTRGC